MTFFNSTYGWYKGNLHTHTTVSDGVKTPLEAAGLYQQQGYDFLALTDHRIMSMAGQYENMLLLTGIELDTMVGHQGYHVIGVGMDQPFVYTGMNEAPQDMIDVILRAGGRAILAHPAWSLLYPHQMAQLKGLTGAEVMNSVSTVPFNGERGNSANLLDIAAVSGGVFPFMAADDTHFYSGEQFQSFIWVNAEKLTREAILAALDQGRFFASQGPRFEQIEIMDGRMKVTCSACEMAVFYSNSLYQHARVQRGGSGTYFEYPIATDEHFLRCEIIDVNGKHAWSSPIRL